MSIRTSKQGIKDDLDHFKDIGLMALTHEGFLVYSQNGNNSPSMKIKTFTLTQKAYEAVDSNFAAPDALFVKHLTPLEDNSGFDQEL